MKQLFRELWANDDAARYQSAVDVLEGRHRWLERDLPDAEAGSRPQTEPAQATASSVQASG